MIKSIKSCGAVADHLMSKSCQRRGVVCWNWALTLKNKTDDLEATYKSSDPCTLQPLRSTVRRSSWEWAPPSLRLENGGWLPSGWESVATPREGVQVSPGLVHEGKHGACDRKKADWCRVSGKAWRERELSWNGKLSIYRLICVPTFNYGHERWVATIRIEMRIKTA